jgi:hypothetical protein
MNSACYDDLTKIVPTENADCDTLLKHFDRHTKARPTAPFLGQRPEIGKDEKGQPTFGDYEWKTFQHVSDVANNIAKSTLTRDLAPEVEGE